MLKVIIIVLLFMLTLVSWHQTKTDTHVLDFGLFTIETPQSWTKVKVQGTDSYVGEIAIDDIDTLSFDLGWYSNTLIEYERFKMGDGKSYYISTSDTSKSISLLDSIGMAKMLRSNISWDSIDGKLAKILIPKVSGKGMTGIYIDSLWQGGSDRVRFNLYGNNLTPANERDALKAFHTLQFHRK